MKVIKYQLCTEANHGTEDTPDIQQIFSAVTLGWSDANEKIAQSEAYNGEVTVEDVPEDIQSQISTLKAQLSSTDYKAIKFAEGWITEEEYAPIKEERQNIRNQINELEAKL